MTDFMAGGRKVAGALALTLMPGGCLPMEMVRFSRAQSAASHSAAAGLPVELPFRRADSLVAVPVTVNGGATADFVLDTGAPVTATWWARTTTPASGWTFSPATIW